MGISSIEAKADYWIAGHLPWSMIFLQRFVFVVPTHSETPES
jgi:hypothetical protein